MKNVLYVGNQLEHKQSNLSYMNTLGPLLETEGFKLRYTSGKVNKVFRLFDMLFTVFKFRKRTDMVLIDTYSTQNFYYALLVSQLCRLLKLKYIPILHGGNLPSRLKQNPRFSQLIFKSAYTNISPSLFMVEAFKSFNYQNVSSIPNTLEIENYRFKSRSFKQVKLLWVRSFSSLYNPELAVKILKALHDEDVTAELCMVGPDSDGSMEQMKALAASLGVRVRFTGKLTKSEWISLSEDYNIFINTTNFDNMPVSVIEAMALGLLVVSTNVGGLPFLIKDKQDGLLVNPNHTDGFVAAIQSVITSPEASERLASLARQKVEQFDWAVVKQQWIKLLD